MTAFQTYKDERFPASNIRLKEADGMSIAWGTFHLRDKLDMQKYSSDTTNSGNKYFLSHFCVSGNTQSTAAECQFRIYDEQHSFFSFKELSAVNLHIAPSRKGYNSFFEYSFSQEYFKEHFIQDSRVLNDMANRIEKESFYWAGKNLCITPSMMSLICEITRQPYSGEMMNLFLESKIMELYLAQIHSFDSYDNRVLKLSRNDIDRLYDARDYISGNLNKRISILTLAREIGINQTKLKTGFKQLFGTTVFDYAIEQKMKLTIALLEEKRLSLTEISDIIGYSHPNHFSSAFKRKFGVSPSMFT
ncbi:MAG: AraC family transcriptional regulator [Bacteroidales bacterium]|jgi:AraC-like DNA-binding protein|nr:AraC family transcriptional regulator [Bacteroidales bacterium]MDD2264346.1 AraC family transcriptional regulator [Bacteroidales bacterium]MDD2831580.1 AraC family transcriptional regulator [Bacteroidales bacterium]MDD3208574.1 AraC family transcriptional regulator [Bacteroidales bacterium]MDD3697013.1 AraC family transcriptional regulator [Bacteroidales bacterium]